MQSNLRKIKAKVTRTTTDIAIVKLDRHGNIEDIDNVDELEYNNPEIVSILEVLEEWE